VKGDQVRKGALVRLAAALVGCGALAIGGVSIASGGAPVAKQSLAAGRLASKGPAAAGRARTDPAKTRVQANETAESSESEAAGETESAADTAAQAAACQKAGIDPNADNVQFDDQTGICSIDSGGDSGD
jgi:hypothetical protein